MQFVAIIILSMLAAVVYGVAHDQITARVCMEYFTIGHAQVTAVPIESPTVIAFVWGVIATWWVGLGLGIPLAICARLGAQPKLAARDLLGPIAVLMIVAAAAALAAGIVGWWLATVGVVQLQGPLAERVPAEKHVLFLADLFAHNASYGVGFLGGVVLCWRTWRRRAAWLAVGSD